MSNLCQQVPWKAMAILLGQPDISEQDLYEHFGCGRCSYGLQDTHGDFGVDVIVLFIEKEEFPTKCYVSWNGFSDND